VITPIGVIEYRGRLHVFRGEADVGPVTRKLCETLTGIQFGDVEAAGEWIFKVK
jgi:branched-chain amino acid aminotransferase